MKLINFDSARRALDKAYRVDEVKEIRDKAQAAQVYARQAKLSADMQMQIAEIKVRAERRAGELLKVMEKPKGGRPSKNPSQRATGSTLEDLGVSRSDSSRWQEVASIPEEKFEAHLCEERSKGKPVTTASTVRLARNGRPQPKPRYPESETVMKWLENLVGFTAHVRTPAGDRTFDQLMASKEWDPAEDTFAVELLGGLQASLKKFHTQAKSYDRPKRKKRNVD